MEYARSVPKPKVQERHSPTHPGSVGGHSPRGRIDNDEQMLDLQRLAERHQREKQQVDAIRQGMDSAISAR